MCRQLISEVLPNETVKKKKEFVYVTGGTLKDPPVDGTSIL